MFWLEGWTGDYTAKVEGRQPNRLLVALSHAADGYPAQIESRFLIKEGLHWYSNLFFGISNSGRPPSHSRQCRLPRQ